MASALTDDESAQIRIAELLMVPDEPWDDREILRAALEHSLLNEEAQERLLDVMKDRTVLLTAHRSPFLLEEVLSDVDVVEADPELEQGWWKNVAAQRLKDLATYMVYGGRFEPHPTFDDIYLVIHATENENENEKTLRNQQQTLSSPLPQRILRGSSGSTTPSTSQSPSASATADLSTLSKMIPQFSGIEEDWFRWKRSFQIALSHFPTIEKIFHHETFATINKEMDRHLYDLVCDKAAEGEAYDVLCTMSHKSGHRAWNDLVVIYEGDLEPVLEDHIVVDGAGNGIVNGTYVRDGENDGVAKFCKREERNRTTSETMSIFRCHLSNNTMYWYISIVPHDTQPGTTRDIDFYSAPNDDTYPDLPPSEGWMKAQEGNDPPPNISVFCR